MGRSLITDIIAAITGIAFVGLALHNPSAVEGESKAGFGGFASALSQAGGTS